MQAEEGGFGAFLESWNLFRDPILAGSLVGAVLGFLGVYVVLRRMVFLSAALSQCAGFGVALALFAEAQWGAVMLVTSPRLATLVVTLATAALLSLTHQDTSTRRDSWLGFAFLLGAAGTLAIGTRISSGNQEIQSILFGSAVAILPEDLLTVVIASAVMLGLHIWWLRGFSQVSLDPDGAYVRGLPVRLLEVTLLLSLALAISLFTQILGALPVFAFSVLPAMAALRVSIHVPMALTVAATLGAAAGFVGYAFAFVYELPVGASQTLVALGAVLAAELVRTAAVRGRRA
ncbi:MAG TPA: metal ABC transporter permease [Vicinamibacteria bacterium]|nr:metal ABC transporter permease [Vicinamibacteria bacterium]